MSRPLRLHAPGLLHHVFARGDDKACIFADDSDCESFLTLLARIGSRFNVRCVAYCLLWNHYHLLLVPDQHHVSRLLQQLNSTYCQRFNRRHNRVGHVLQGRFGCRIVEDGLYARTVLRYLALNPVAAGRAATAEEWRWSSYRFIAAPDQVPEFLSLDYVWTAFGTTDAALGRKRFVDHVRAGLQEAFSNPLLHGSSDFGEHLSPALEPHQATRDFIYAHRFAARPTLGSLLEGRAAGTPLDEAVHAAFHRHAYTLTEIAAAVSRDPSTICRWIQRASRRQTSTVGSSSVEDNPAKNKI